MNWITGEVAPADLAEVTAPVILDGAQGAGAVAVRRQGAQLRGLRRRRPEVAVRRGRHRDAVPGPDFGERVRTIAPGYMAFEDATRGLDSTFRAGGRRFDAPLAREAVALSLAAYQMLVAAASTRAIERAADLADTFAAALPRPATPSRRAGAPRSSPSSTPSRGGAPAARRPGVAVRNLPGYPYLRASVGAWNDESDLDRLLEALSERGLRLLRLEPRLGPRVPGGDQGPRPDARRRAGSAWSTAAPRSA